ncbi:hypothetical protein BC343_15020 [Mucilaginibacter pedocola]|uniref:Helix-turn-helix domain-containing protein n=1 Tax=Mucilaginibacter pedocola TaxID=1792845 RepID=A0A1S9P9A3_9SPHI|nr:hypothetical protein BC343_15020 [Mucilaginibacter pedocola]
MNNKHDPFLNRKEAARHTKLSPHSFKTWDSRKTYDLKPEMRGGRVVYRRSVLDAFLEQRLIKHAKR